MKVEKVLKTTTIKDSIIFDDNNINNDDLLNIELNKINNLQEFNVFFNISNYEKNYELLDAIINHLHENINAKFNFYCLYDSEPIFSPSNVKSLRNLNKEINEKFNTEILVPYEQIDLNLYDEKKVVGFYKFKEVAKANSLLNDVASEILQQNFSQFEKFIAAYAYVTNYVYTHEDKDENPEISRTAINAINYKKIVCPAYVNMLKQLCNLLDIPFCEVGEYSIKYKTMHMKGIVKIEDQKYNIFGIYATDPTNDSKISDNKAFFYSLLPLQVKFSDAVIQSNTLAEVFYRGLGKDKEKIKTFVKNEIELKGFSIYDKLSKLGFLKSYRIISEVKQHLENRNKTYLDQNNNQSNYIELKQEIEQATNRQIENQIKTNIKAIENMHNLANNSQAPNVLSFANAMYNVFKNINLDYFDNPNPTDEEVKSFVNNSINYSINRNLNLMDELSNANKISFVNELLQKNK